jgi:hypothetical protein
MRQEGYVTNKNSTFSGKRPVGETKDPKRMRSTSATKKFSSNIQNSVIAQNGIFKKNNPSLLSNAVLPSRQPQE